MIRGHGHVGLGAWSSPRRKLPGATAQGAADASVHNGALGSFSHSSTPSLSCKQPPLPAETVSAHGKAGAAFSQITVTALLLFFPSLPVLPTYVNVKPSFILPSRPQQRPPDVLQLKQGESFRPGVTKCSIHSGRRVSVWAAGLLRVTPCPQAPLSTSVPSLYPGLVLEMAQLRAWQLLLALPSSLKSLF